ncbi:hypothetical protein [Pseudaestuariivita atlantica]|uniref:Uncharacterized protein n=1 Tax=Pseudaestuariivita atlantica TaxID=1317121 RepID=A0A0L1JSV6_9RHOB|nr:hypothetical protein [Pseudaestuariivita atlantica]KNG94835.1 hypothetical protein ATO11_05475 [Pseudaestuariivita atlantica]
MFRLLALLLLAAPASAAPLFPNSVVSNDLDFIRPDDPTLFACTTYRGTDRREMPDKRGGPLFADGVHVVEARFRDGTRMDITVHPDAGGATRATALADTVGASIGRLPGAMRAKLSHVVILDGDETAFAEDKGRFFVLYTHNIARRLQTRDLDETVFHESVHATLDIPHAASRAWRKAQRRDGTAITDYALRNPAGEDLAETALFAFAMVHHPGRLPARIEQAVRDTVPARLAYLTDLFTRMGRHPAPATANPACT